MTHCTLSHQTSYTDSAVGILNIVFFTNSNGVHLTLTFSCSTRPFMLQYSKMRKSQVFFSKEGDIP